MNQKSPEALGSTVLALLRADRFADVQELFAPQVRAMVTADTLRDAWASEIARSGAVLEAGTPVAESSAIATVVRIPVELERGRMTLVASVSESGWLMGLQLAPESAAASLADWEPPVYADPATFDEVGVLVGSGPLAVPGTLSVPQTSGPHPAVVLLQGSGPSDRDASIGPNKPFKDLAWGLATLGVAVLRFDKVTYVHRAEAARNPSFTAADEYLPSASAAIDVLQHHESIDAERVYVLGHSLGGTMAPRVAEANPTVAGLILLGGGTEALPWAAVRQVRYLASLRPETAAQSDPIIETMTKQAERVDSPDLSPDTPTSELPFGVPASYWLDLRSYHPVEVAARVHKPMLVLQGGRDYQATVSGDLADWQAGLAGRTDVTVHVYDADNHFFFPGSGPSSPVEYEAVQHLDHAVVADIVEWMADLAHTGLS